MCAKYKAPRQPNELGLVADHLPDAFLDRHVVAAKDLAISA
jgi:hypothetical protein